MFAGTGSDSVLKARVVKIKDQQITRYGVVVRLYLLRMTLLCVVFLHSRQTSKKGATIKVLELTTIPR